MSIISIGKEIELDVDFETLLTFDTLVEQAVRFAVKQALTNTHASIKADEPDAYEKSLAVAQKRLDAMMTGSWGQTERGSSIDDVTREMREMAESEIKGQLVKAGKKVKDIDKKVLRAAITSHMERNDERFRKAAIAKLAIVVDAPSESIDLADLGL